jgi:hypothetical protein
MPAVCSSKSFADGIKKANPGLQVLDAGSGDHGRLTCSLLLIAGRHPNGRPIKQPVEVVRPWGPCGAPRGHPADSASFLDT